MTSRDFPEHLFESTADSVGDAPALRAALLQRTLSVVRRRRYVRRAGFTAALVACYLAGVGTLALLRPPSSRVPAGGTDVAEAIQPGASRDWIEDTRLEQKLAKMSQYERLRDMGTRLEQRGDLMAATRLYNRALDLAQVGERNPEPDSDSWLLLALKNERTREGRNHDTL